MFYEFATKKAFMINKLRQEILVEYAFADEEDDNDQGIARFDYPMYLSDFDIKKLISQNFQFGHFVNNQI
jgi:hypothetical protein